MLLVLSAVPVHESDAAELTAAESSSLSSWQHLDGMDEFNHPRQRRALILAALQRRSVTASTNNSNGDDGGAGNNNNNGIVFQCPTTAATAVVSHSRSGNHHHHHHTADDDDNNSNTTSILHSVYSLVHSEGLLEFLRTAWTKWEALGEGGRDPIGCLLPSAASTTTTTPNKTTTTTTTIPCLIPANMPLARLSQQQPQRPSKHVIGQMGYYCNDTCTPIFAELRHELESDAIVTQMAIDGVLKNIPKQQQQQPPEEITSTTIYLLPNHPGHHACKDSFGGYCYLNHVAAIAKTISATDAKNDRVAILDVDYHCGNGTASIFYDDPLILVVSIHCDPDCDYPFHTGYSDDTGSSSSAAEHTTLHLPLPPGTGWDTGYRQALARALPVVTQFQPCAVVISLGLDTYEQDPCAIRRAGFALQGPDYTALGHLLAQHIPHNVPTIFVQEGGYRMDTIGEAATNVVYTFSQHRSCGSGGGGTNECNEMHTDQLAD